MKAVEKLFVNKSYGFEHFWNQASIPKIEMSKEDEYAFFVKTSNL